MRESLRAGIAIYNEGYAHAAHDPWEAHWLELESGTDDERLLHGLIQFTAAIYHAQSRNWEGTVGLSQRAVGYLQGLPDDYRDVNVGDVRRYLRALETDPELIDRRPPLALEYDRQRLGLADLEPEAQVRAAGSLAEELGYPRSVVDAGAEFAVEALEAGESSRFLALICDFVGEPERRALAFDRLERHVERRQSKARDVDGLFDP